MQEKQITIDASDYTAEEYANLFEQYAMDEGSCKRTTLGMSPTECELAARILRAGPDKHPAAFKLAMFRGALACDVWRLYNRLVDGMDADDRRAAFDSVCGRGFGFMEVAGNLLES